MLSTLRDTTALTRAMARNGLSRRALAARITDAGYPVSHQRVAQLASGEYPNVTPELGTRIEAALGVKRGQLFRLHNKPARADKGMPRS